MTGPIDFVVVGFDGNNFDGSILKALGDAIDSGVIKLRALHFVTKDAEGTVDVLDIQSSGSDYIVEFVEKYYDGSNDIVQDDMDELAEVMENNTSAGLLVIEQLWAKPLKEAIVNANGFLIAEGRLHPEAAAELETEE